MKCVARLRAVLSNALSAKRDRIMISHEECIDWIEVVFHTSTGSIAYASMMFLHFLSDIYCNDSTISRISSRISVLPREMVRSITINIKD